MSNSLKNSLLLFCIVICSKNSLSQDLKDCNNELITNDSIIQLHKEYVTLCQDTLKKYYRLRQYEKHADLAEKAKHIGEKHFCDSNLLHVYKYEVLNNNDRGKDGSAHFDKYFSHIKKIPGANGLKSSLVVAISIHFRHKDRDRSLELLNYADSFKFDYKGDHYRSWHYLMDLEYKNAKFYCDRLIKNSKLYKDKEYLAYAHMDKANIFVKLRKNKEAILYFKKQLNLLKENNLSTCQALTSIGYQFAKLKELDSAIFYLDQAILEAKRGNFPPHLFQAQSMIGSVYLDYTNQYSVAKNYFEQSLKLSKAYSYKDRNFKNLYYLGECHYKMGDSKTAWKYCSEAYAMNSSNLKFQIQLLILMQKLQNEKGNYKLAHTYATELITAKDSLTAKDLNKINNRLLREKDKRLTEELAVSEKEKRQKEKMKSYLYIIVLASIVLLLILGIFFYYVIRNNKLKRKIEKAEHQIIQETLRTNITELEEKEAKVNELKLKLQDTNVQLKELESSNDLSHENKLSEILSNGINSNESISQFITEFQRQYPIFCEQIIKKTDSRITNTDLKLIALIKLNLSSNEISSLLNITSSGVKKARSRLRKKLSLKEKESLDDYIKSL